MAFTSSITVRPVAVGNRRMSHGEYLSGGGSTGGDINTGLRTCDLIILQPLGAAVGTNQSVVNETLPVAGSAVTIVTDANQGGYWQAWGY